MSRPVCPASEKSARLRMAKGMSNAFYVSFIDICGVISATISGAFLTKFFVKLWRFLELAMKLPGPCPYPIVGNALRFACKSEDLLQRIVEVIRPYADVTPMRVWMGPRLYVIVTEPRDIEVILNSQQGSNKGGVYKFLLPFIGNGLISGSGSLWRIHRKLILHILNQRVLDSFVESFDRHARILVKRFKPFADGKTFDAFAPFEECTVNVCCETIMGCSDVDALQETDKEFRHHTALMYKIVHERMLKIWLYPDWIFRRTKNYRLQCQSTQLIHRFTEKCVEVQRKKLAENSSDKYSLLERLIVANDVLKEMTDEELRDEIFTVYIAAQDTVALISAFSTLMLAMHKDVQEKARIEVDEIFDDGDITIESLSKLKYMEMVIKETLRLYPAASLMVRKSTGEIKLEKCTLPEDCHIVIATILTQRSAKYWPNPEEFIPERFLAEHSSERHPYSFLPFSGGPMGCIGQKYAMMSIKILMAHVLRNYFIDTSVKLCDVKLKTDISIRSVNGYKVSMKPREDIAQNETIS